MKSTTTKSVRLALLPLTFAGFTVLLAACAADTTSPSARKSTTEERVSSFVPTAATKALIGVSDGTYSVTFNPQVSNSFSLGPNRIDIPARAVCRLATSGYGSAYWNQSCTPEWLPVNMTVVISGAASANPRVDFFPAMRFNPTTQVQLFMYVPNATAADATNWIMKYCNDANVCVNEATADRDLTSYVDRTNNVVFRRIKHFSGYVVAENSDSTAMEGQ